MMNGERMSLSERLLSQKEVERACTILLLVFCLGVVASFVSAARNQGRMISGSILGADFPAFYVAGTIINQHGLSSLYDLTLQTQLYHQLFPQAEANTLLPYVNAPFFALPLPLLARLPYPWAYACWLLLSTLLYVGGFTLLWRELKGVPSAAYRTALLLALTFMPFAMECLICGQSSAFGFFFLALALTLERRGHLGASGAVLALLTYKPTLLLLIGPMILLTRRWRTLAGLVTGGFAVAALSYALVGWTGFQGWLNILRVFSQHAAGETSGLLTWKYVDINSFARLLFGANVWLRWLTVGTVVAFFLPQIMRVWWQDTAPTTAPAMRNSTNGTTSWAVTLAWLPVLNMYIGYYDATLVALSAMLVTEWFYQVAPELPRPYRLAILGLYVTPWLSQKLAQNFGLQLFTLALIAWGTYVLRLVQAAHASSWQTALTTPKQTRSSEMPVTIAPSV